MVRIVLALAFASLCGASCVSNKPNECDGTNCIGKKNPCIVPTNVRITRREREPPGTSVKPRWLLVQTECQLALATRAARTTRACENKNAPQTISLEGACTRSPRCSCKLHDSLYQRPHSALSPSPSLPRPR